MRRLLLPFALVVLLAAGEAPARPTDRLYDDATLAYWQARYPSGVQANLDEVIGAVLTAAERARLRGVRLRFPLKVEGAEPLAFFVQREEITFSVASLKLLDDLGLAIAWLQLRGYDWSTAFEYVHWLRYGAAETGGRLPPPLEALCIPDDARADPAVDHLAQELLKGKVFFVLGHELGHVLYGHPGYAGLTSREARDNEAAADRFALDLFRRLGEAPLALASFFMLTAYAEPSRGDFASEAEWRAAVARRTHPVNDARLRTVAAHLRAHADAYDPAAASVPDMLDVIADTLADPEMQAFLADRGRRVTLASLAPRRPGQSLGPPCGAEASALAFDGSLSGTFFAGNVEFAVQLWLVRDGERVRGSFDYGTGPGIMEGIVAGDELVYRWQHGGSWGAGRIRQAGNGRYTGTWGWGQAAEGGGTFELE